MPLSADSPHNADEIKLFGVRVKVGKEGGGASGYAAAPPPFARAKPKRG